MMKHKFLALTFLLSTSFQVMANGDEAPYDGRQYIVKGIKLNKNKELAPTRSGDAIISTVQVQALGSYFDGGVFAKDTIVEHNSSKVVKSSNSAELWNTFHAHHLPVNFSYDLRRPKNGEIIDVNDDDGSLTLFAIKRNLESMDEGEDKNKVAFFHHFLESRLNLKTPQTLEGYVYYPDISEKTTQAVRISGFATFVNNQPLAGFSADDLPRGILDNTIKPHSITFFSFAHDHLDCKVSFLDVKPLTIDVKEPVSNIILKELEGGDVSLTESKIQVTKNTPFSLEAGQTLDCTTERSFGPLEKLAECSGLGNFLAYHALYTMPGLSVSMGPIFHENLEKTSRSVPDSWSRSVSPKAIYHFDKFFLDKLNELAGNK
ncbi:MAG: hypothetical protein ACRCYP_01430 [Alphaproteobacteria bacterium]